VIALVILVFVDAHDAATPLPGALARAAEEALGSDASVSIRTLPPDASATALLDAGRAAHATAVARIAWVDERHAEARLEIVSPEGGPARGSTITFDASDPVEERGRAIGLILAALLAPEKQAQREKSRRAEAPPIAAVAATSPPPLAPRRFALDAAVEGGLAIDGAGSGVGGALGLRWQPKDRVAIRLGIQARFGQVAVAQAAAMDLAGAAGLVLFLVPPSDGTRYALALRADALLIYESLSHLSSDDPEPVRGAHLLPGAQALVEGQAALSPTLGLQLAVGPEFAFGRTDVFVHQAKVAQLSPFRLVVAGGLVARF